MDAALRKALSPWAGPDLVGVTCLAPGTDQIFARAVLDHGGRVEVVLPAPDYREAGLEPDDRREFDRLLASAARLSFSGCPSSGPEAYFAASSIVIARSDRFLAVWDGTPDAVPGGTGDAVAYARSRHVPTDVVWPSGARRLVPSRPVL